MSCICHRASLQSSSMRKSAATWGLYMSTSNTNLACSDGHDLAVNDYTKRNGGYFEYKVVKVSDLMDGGANVSKIEELLNLYAEMGWRLSQTVVNEIGRGAVVTEEDRPRLSIQEETLLILERWIPVS